MLLLERGLRVTGGFFGARSVINAEIAAPNSAVNKLDDIFKNNTPKPQAEAVTPNGFRVKVPQNTKPLQAIENPVLEMRGRGGYETNQITDKLGTKIPKVRQPFEVSPSMKPSAANKPLGETEKVRPNSAPENIRGLTRQNEAAETLAKNGYKVEQKPQLTNIDRISNPWLKAEKKPDFKIEGEIFDAYTPSKNKLAENIRSEINSKIEKGQTRRIALNMDDSQVSLDELKKVIWEKPISELEQILVVKDGKVTNFFPFK
jgi:Contact-dependent growth inhibition CdiA C-terminal domain